MNKRKSLAIVGTIVLLPILAGCLPKDGEVTSKKVVPTGSSECQEYDANGTCSLSVPVKEDHYQLCVRDNNDQHVKCEDVQKAEYDKYKVGDKYQP